MAVRRQVVVPARGRDHDRAEGCCQARLDCCLVGADGVMAAVAGHEHAGGQRSPVPDAEVCALLSVLDVT
jgi:hypothetical protein